MFKKYTTVLLLFISAAAIAQEGLPIPRNIDKTYLKGTRSKDGIPGSKYWQNTADYSIKVNFDPGTLLVSGSETISYVNNSPDTLTELVLKLYPNLYKKGSPRMQKIADEDAGEGMAVENVKVNDAAVVGRVEGTNMLVTIAPLKPGGKLSFRVDFKYTLNKGSHYRTGRVDVNSAFIAYFFPRIAVYDDVDGWNRSQYLGTQEFYNDFCNFKAAVTVPGDYLVWATGDLKNCTEVFYDKYCKRLQLSEIKDAPTFIVDSIDLAAGNVTKNKTSNTWVFEASNVTDFVFATASNYVWEASSLVVDSTTYRRTRVDAVFNTKHRDYYDVLGYNRKSVQAISFRFPKWPFPYSHETVFDGLDQMEYPMMVNDNPLEKFDAITTTDHEVFHTMFPFYMGINETKYGWMDEGWATIGEWLISPMIDSSIVDDYGLKRYAEAAGSEVDLPVMTPSTQLDGVAFFLNSYVKPGLGYLYVKDYLGEELFNKGLHFYIQNWNGKHPMPFDFFNAINTGSGKNLNWFWKKWFFDSGFPDLRLADVKKKGKKYTITVESKGTKPTPVDLTLYLDNNSVIKEHRSIGVWEDGAGKTKITVKTDKGVKRVVLGSLYNVDVDQKDNSWERK